jgi:hypothetical protein
VTGNATYAVRSVTTGSNRLAQLLLIEITSQASGAVVYRGSLADAAIDGALGVGSFPGTRAAETFIVTGQLPATAGNEMRGAHLGVEWVVRATAVTGP